MFLPLLATAAASCFEADPLLVDIEDWALLDPASDPWPGGASREACRPRAAHPEAGFVEIDTEICDWVSISAPLRSPIRRGDRLEFLFFHTALVAPEPTQATVGLMIGEVIVWELALEVPAATDFYEVQVDDPPRARRETAATLHVHNHGANSYRFGQLRRAPSP